MDLTKEEIELTEKLGFDLAVVSRIKDEVGMPLKEFKEEEAVSPNAELSERHSSIWTPKTRQMQVSILKGILKRSPDAAELINGWIAELEGPLSEEERHSLESEEQDREFWQKAAPYSNYLAAENERIRKESLGGHFTLPSFWMNAGRSVEERLAEMKAYFDGKPEPKAKEVVKPVGMVFAMESFNWRLMQGRLQKELMELGYKLDSLVSFHFTADFETKTEAEQFKELRKDLPCLEIICLNDGGYEIQPSTGSLKFPLLHGQ